LDFDFEKLKKIEKRDPVSISDVFSRQNRSPIAKASELRYTATKILR
jgi:hypothetical protein